MIKRTLAIMVLALALVLSLAACGMGNNSDANNADNADNGTDTESPADRAGNGMTDPANGTGIGADMESPADNANNGTGTENPADNSGITAPNGAAIYGSMQGTGRDRNVRRNDAASDAANSGMNSRDGSAFESGNTSAAGNPTLRGGSMYSRNAAQDAADRTRYALMLDNGRVRDTDGFLFDGENPQHNTFY